MDFQNRGGAKTGSGAPMSADQAQLDHRERLRRLALETVDIKKDPYIFRNHIGQYECRLCLTVHPSVENYLVHTQGKKHQSNLSRRAAQEAQEKAVTPAPKKKVQVKKNFVKIGRPGYRVLKQKDPASGERSLLFEIEYPEITSGLQPRHRIMSAYEQKVEAPDRNFQYLVVAAEPYETVAFKVPNMEIDRDPERFYTNWNRDTKTFTIQFFFKTTSQQPSTQTSAPAHQPVRHYHGPTAM